MHLDSQWIVGFVDGEGNFHVSIKKDEKNQDAACVSFAFTIVQDQPNAHVLFALKFYFKCGSVRRLDPGKQYYQVKNVDHLSGIIIPFFEKHPLKTKKRILFQNFRKILLKVKNEKHLTFCDIAKFQTKIESDSFGNRRDLSSEIPCRVSSDLHEWRNDLGAVSTRDSVKL